MDIIHKSIRRHDFVSGEPSKYTIIHGLGGDIIGYRGSQTFEAGYIYAPYIPMVLEGEFEPRRGLASRYATKVVNSDFYGRITVNEVYNGVQLPNVNRSFV